MPKVVALLSALLALALAGPLANAAPLPAGALNSLGCVANPTDAPLLGCSAGDASLNRLHEIALSPDANQIYVAGSDAEDSIAGRLVTLNRDSASGALVFAGCRGPGVAGCTADSHLDEPGSIALPPDGSDLYVADYGVGVIHYRRAAGGALTFANCLTSTAAPGCTVTSGVSGPTGVAVSPDGKSLYVSGYSTSTVAVLDRNLSTGALTLRECFTSGSAPGCTPAGAADLTSATDVAVTGDGARVFVSARGGGVTSFARGSDGALTGPQWLSGDFLNGAQALGVAPGGKAPYVGLFDGSGLTALAADPATGALTLTNCLLFTGTVDCPASPGVRGVFGLAFSPAGDVLYAAARDGSTLGSFRRGANGALSFVSCIDTAFAPEPGCASRVDGVAGAESVAATPDGRFVYSAGFSSIATFDPEHAPVCTPVAPRSVASSVAIDIDVRCSDAADGQAISYAVARQPAHGAARVLDAVGGRVRYRSARGYTGADSFSVAASDGTNATPVEIAMTVGKTPKPLMRIRVKRARLSSRGKLRIRLSCTRGTPDVCAGRLSLRSARKLPPTAAVRKPRKRFVKLGARPVSVADGKTRWLTVTVPKRGRAVVAAKDALKAVVTVSIRNPAGQAGRAKRQVTLLEPKQPR
ncbi:MAG TPA: beta-propeller fold lactonase family protein [Thermoleophilaceae bacterium]|nr:beta-propeller fold lactonase family protein [Thermoleophilaceae bacterium]